MVSRSAAGITFAVDDVEPATEPLTEWSTREAMTAAAGEIVECHAPERPMVQTWSHPLMEAVHPAYREHRPLVLTPDAVWITIAQGLRTHIHRNAEALRHDLVRHEGKLKLAVDATSSLAWPSVIDAFAGLVRAETPELHDLFVCDFSTTGLVERTASLVTLMEAVRDYFDFAVRCICGIPTITLAGTPGDWEKLHAKVERLSSYGMADWVEHLRPLTEAFVATASGNIDIVFWQSICKLRRAYGGNIINGWIIVLFPFLKDGITQEPTRKSPFFARPKEAWRHDPGSAPGITTSELPRALSSAACAWLDVATGTDRAMEFLGGLAGVSQDPETLALRPEAGWAVREAAPIIAGIARLLREAEVREPVSNEVLHARLHGRKTRLPGVVPAELMRLYYATDGARLGDVRILRFEELKQIRCDECGSGETSLTRWVRFADLPGGRFLVIARSGRPYRVVALGSIDTPGPHDEIAVVATSVQELLTRLLDGGATPYFEQPGFVPVSIAHWSNPSPLSPTDRHGARWLEQRTARMARLAGAAR